MNTSLRARYLQCFLLLPFALFISHSQVVRAQSASEPSFDCTKAATESEALICRDGELAALERKMADVYYAVLQHLPPEQDKSFRRQHYEWSMGYRSTCNSPMAEERRKSCISSYLTEHIGQLQAMLSEVESGAITSNAFTPMSSGKATSPTRDESSLESVFPRSFDRHHQYSSYSYDDLVSHIKTSFKITNNFVGERVKVVALYDASSVLMTNIVNRTKHPTFSNMGCQTAFCDRLEVIFSRERATGWHGIKESFFGVDIFLYFRDSGRYAEFLKAAQQNGYCTAANPCYILAAGALKTSTVESQSLIGIKRQIDLVYLDVDEVALFKSSDYIGAKVLLNSAGQGFKLGAQIYSGLQGIGQ